MQEACFLLAPLPAQACNSLIDLDADVLISAACLVYAELIQKDVRCPEHLSFSPSSSFPDFPRPAGTGQALGASEAW